MIIGGRTALCGIDVPFQLIHCECLTTTVGLIVNLPARESHCINHATAHNLGLASVTLNVISRSMPDLTSRQHSSKQATATF